jgi:hypothetical protein
LLVLSWNLAHIRLIHFLKLSVSSG